MRKCPNVRPNRCAEYLIGYQKVETKNRQRASERSTPFLRNDGDLLKAENTTLSQKILRAKPVKAAIILPEPPRILIE